MTEGRDLRMQGCKDNIQFIQSYICFVFRFPVLPSTVMVSAKVDWRYTHFLCIWIATMCAVVPSSIMGSGQVDGRPKAASIVVSWIGLNYGQRSSEGWQQTFWSAKVKPHIERTDCVSLVP